ncbi:MAG TPA: hypothetical protein VGF22_10035, partial [Acidimicrobiales bacterium]
MAVELQARLAMARWDPGVRQQPDGYRHTDGGPVSAPLIAVLDYGIGNLRSAQKALQRVGA